MGDSLAKCQYSASLHLLSFAHAVPSTCGCFQAFSLSWHMLVLPHQVSTMSPPGGSHLLCFQDTWHVITWEHTSSCCSVSVCWGTDSLFNCIPSSGLNTEKVPSESSLIYGALVMYFHNMQILLMEQQRLWLTLDQRLSSSWPWSSPMNYGWYLK